MRGIMAEAIPPFEPEGWIVRADCVFGAFAGVLMGAAVGWTCCWFVCEVGSESGGALIGAMLGSVGGIALGARHGNRRRDLVSSDLGTTVCFFYPLLPALLIVLGGVGLI